MRGWLPKAHRTTLPRQGSFPRYKVYGVLSIISSSRSHKLLGPHRGAGIGIVPILQMRKQRSGEEKNLLKVTPPPTQFCGPRWGAEEGAGGERRVSLPRHARSRPNGQPFSSALSFQPPSSPHPQTEQVSPMSQEQLLTLQRVAWEPGPGAQPGSARTICGTKA